MQMLRVLACILCVSRRSEVGHTRSIYGNRKSTLVFFGYLRLYERDIGSFELQKLPFMEVLEMRKKRKTGGGSLGPSPE
jgi:hypothetical protein